MSPQRHQLSGASSAEGHGDAQASPVKRGWGSWLVQLERGQLWGTWQQPRSQEEIVTQMEPGSSQLCLGHNKKKRETEAMYKKILLPCRHSDVGAVCQGCTVSILEGFKAPFRHNPEQSGLISVQILLWVGGCNRVCRFWPPWIFQWSWDQSMAMMPTSILEVLSPLALDLMCSGRRTAWE